MLPVAEDPRVLHLPALGPLRAMSPQERSARRQRSIDLENYPLLFAFNIATPFSDVLSTFVADRDYAVTGYSLDAGYTGGTTSTASFVVSLANTPNYNFGNTLVRGGTILQHRWGASPTPLHVDRVYTESRFTIRHNQSIYLRVATGTPFGNIRWEMSLTVDLLPL